MSNLTNVTMTAREFALDLHKNDNYGTRPYSDHLFAVVNNAVEINNGLFNDEEIMDIAWLHDTLEDYPKFEGTIKEFFPTYFDTIKLLSRDKSITYSDYIDSILESNDLRATIVKIADLKSNLVNVSESLEPRYRKALGLLERHLSTYK